MSKATTDADKRAEGWRRERDSAIVKADAEMLRVKACEHIAYGEGDWEKLRNVCPSTAAVAWLRDHAMTLRALVGDMLEQQVCTDEWKEAAQAALHEGAHEQNAGVTDGAPPFGPSRSGRARVS